MTGAAGSSERLFVETPEQVAFELPLAGPGSRFGALVVDGACILLVAFGLLLLLVRAEGLLLGWVEGRSPFLGVVAIASAVALFWGWFFAFEALGGGRTPGKRLFGLRTVRADGAPLGAREAAIRNLLRIVDLQPGFTCGVGGLTMLLDAKGRRLGDLAAGTVVVREKRIAFPDVQPIRQAGAVGPVRLSDEAFDALSAFQGRATSLPPEVRGRLALRFSAQLARLDPEGSAAATDATAFVSAFHAEEVARRAAARRSLDAGAPSAVRQLEQKRGRWAELAEHFKGRRRRRDEQQVARDAALLRELSSDLARARTYGASAGTILSLERLVAQAHAGLYRGRPVRWRGFAEFFAGGFPERVRRAGRSMGLAAAVFVLPGLVTFAFVRTHPEWESALAGESMVERARAASANPTFDYRDTWEDAWMGSEALSTFLIANNVQVALLAFAGGMTLGVFTFYLLLQNGLAIGAALAVFANHGVLENLVTFIVPHGGIELTAIVLSGGAAFHLASGFWRPGRRARGVVLRERAREAVAVVGGVVAMLVLAGIIEGFLSPARLPAPVKWSAGAVAALGLVLYFLGRSQGAGGLDVEVAGDGELDRPAGRDVQHRDPAFAEAG